MICISGQTCAEVWSKAIVALNEQKSGDQYNVILEILEPIAMKPEDHGLIKAIDDLLRSAGKQPVHTVSQTIFPDGEYKLSGKSGVFNTYPEKLYPILKKGWWGTYVHRMVRWPNPKGGTINQLEMLIDKISSVRGNGQKLRNCYELATIDPCMDLPLYAPEKDCKRRIGGPCLSHLSFKVDFDLDPEILRLTAVYRNHYYFERLLGNLLGLARLMGFIAFESGMTKTISESPGPLTIHSTHAVIDGKRTELVKLASDYLNAVG